MSECTSDEVPLTLKGISVETCKSPEYQQHQQYQQKQNLDKDRHDRQDGPLAVQVYAQIMKNRVKHERYKDIQKTHRRQTKTMHDKIHRSGVGIVQSGALQTRWIEIPQQTPESDCLSLKTKRASSRFEDLMARISGDDAKWESDVSKKSPDNGRAVLGDKQSYRSDDLVHDGTVAKDIGHSRPYRSTHDITGGRLKSLRSFDIQDMVKRLEKVAVKDKNIGNRPSFRDGFNDEKDDGGDGDRCRESRYTGLVYQWQ